MSKIPNTPTTRSAPLQRFRQPLWIRAFATASLLTFPATWGNWGVLAAQSEEEQQQISIWSEKADALFSQVEMEWEKVILPDHDIQAFADSLPDAPETIAEVIRNRTHWQPYSGLLKGAEGTLFSGAGNSLDRALLFRHVLKLKGYDVRIAYNTQVDPILGKKWYEQLCNHQPTMPNPEGQLVDIDQLLKAKLESEAFNQVEFEAYAERMTRNASYYETLETMTARQTDRLLAAMGSPGEDADFPKSEVITEHFWVQINRDGNWENLCLEFGDPIACGINPESVQIATKADELPQEWIHRTTFRVIVEQQLGEQITKQIALDHALEAHRFGNRQIDFYFQPNGGINGSEILTDKPDSESRKQTLMETIESPETWVPMLKIAGVEEPILQLQFDRTGTLANPGDPAQSGKGKKFNEASGLLGGISFESPESEEPGGILRSIAFEVEVSGPGIETRVERRVLFENPEGLQTSDPSSELGKSIAYATTRRSHILIQNYELTQDHLNYLQLITLRELKLPVQYLLRTYIKEPETFSPELIEKVAKKVPQFHSPLFTLVGQRSLNMQRSHLFLNQCNVISFSSDFRIRQEELKSHAGYDIMHNQVSAHANGLIAARAQLHAGVFDTVLEHLLIRFIAEKEGVEQYGMAGYFEEMHNHDDWILVEDERSFKTIQEKYRPDVQAYVQSDLVRGYQVLLPSDPVTSDPTSWWRVNPTNGETLGMTCGPSGLGGNEAVSYLVLAKFTALTLLNIFSLGKCLYAAEAAGKSGIGCTICALFTQATIFVSIGLSGDIATILDILAGGVGFGCLLTLTEPQPPTGRNGELSHVQPLLIC